jgi:hypothetical protein
MPELQAEHTGRMDPGTMATIKAAAGAYETMSARRARKADRKDVRALARALLDHQDRLGDVGELFEKIATAIEDHELRLQKVEKRSRPAP